MQKIVPISAGSTNCGRVRSKNEDDYLVDSQIALFAVADGLGGHGSGNVASSLAIETLQDEYQQGLLALKNNTIDDSQQLIGLVRHAISEVNKTIYKINKKKGFTDGAGMGSTLVGICFYNQNKSFVSFNIGDSRLYRTETGTLLQSTKDHSLLQEWQDSGRLGEPPAANLLKRAVGIFPDVDADFTLHSTVPNELLVLCSDGLTAMVDKKIIGSIVFDLYDNDPIEICTSLINRANTEGGKDNITVVAIKT